MKSIFGMFLFLFLFCLFQVVNLFTVYVVCLILGTIGLGDVSFLIFLLGWPVGGVVAAILAMRVAARFDPSRNVAKEKQC